MSYNIIKAKNGLGVKKMNRLCWFIGLLSIAISAGCNYDIVATSRLKAITTKCVCIQPIESENPNVGKVLRDVLEKEFIRKQVEICDPNSATVFITGSTFLAIRSTGSETKLYIVGSGSFVSSQAIESVSLIAKDRDGEILLTASYDNKERYSASKLAKEFGSALANKLK
jgi:hypothetical protein